MSILETPKAPRPADASQNLKSELKEWEKAFAAAHGGRKAGREDIKQNLEIAFKYKQYNRFRVALSNPATTPRIKKRPSSTAPPKQPSPKRPQLLQPTHPAILDPYDSPRSIHRTPTLRHTCIGPTPQKDGRVLGLFDLLSPESNDWNTPLKRRSLDTANLDALVTPSKAIKSVSVETQAGNPFCRRPPTSPMSAAQSAQKGHFITPSVPRRSEQRTPGSKNEVSKLRFDVTPAFLRRDSQGARNVSQKQKMSLLDENEEVSWSPVAIRRRPNPLGRSLSALVQGIRALEDEKLDEEMEMMRENERDDVLAREARRSPVKDPTVAVGDSQVAEMPLGPDGAGESEDSEDNHDRGKGKDGKALKVWKKKGQKRSSRKSNMKPATAKWKPEAKWKAPHDTDKEDEPGLVPETQGLDHAAPGDLTAGIEDNDDMEFLTKAGEDFGGDKTDAKLVVAKQGKAKENNVSKHREGDTKGAPKNKKKIGPSAYANFRALKIKNKQSKAKGSGRFGRKRR